MQAPRLAVAGGTGDPPPPPRPPKSATIIPFPLERRAPPQQRSEPAREPTRSGKPPPSS